MRLQGLLYLVPVCWYGHEGRAEADGYVVGVHHVFVAGRKEDDDEERDGLHDDEEFDGA